MEISIQQLVSRNPELAHDIRETASRIEGGADIELFRHDYEQIRKLMKAPPKSQLTFQGHELLSGRQKRPRKKRPEEAPLFVA